MTEKLYYEDAFLREFTAVITNIIQEDSKYFAILDRTAFYPEGGGQGADHGSLTLADGTILPVVDVQECDGDIYHEIILDAITMNASAIVPENMSAMVDQSVTGHINWARRFDHMQQHSGEHIVSGMICRRFHCDNVGFHLGEDIVTIDFNTRISYAEALEIESAANAYLWEDHPFEVLWPTPQELKDLEYRSKKELTGAVRIARFPGADTCACCGTHVARSSQVGLVKFLSAKNFHEGTRLELLCGQRAFRYLSMNHTRNKEVAVLLSTSEENTSAYVQKVLDENLQLRAHASSLQNQLFHAWAQGNAGKGNVLVLAGMLSPDQTRALADQMADQCGAMAAVFAEGEGKCNYAVIHRDAEISEFIRQMNQALHGRGGGRNGFAQGSVEATQEQIRAFFEDAAEPFSVFVPEKN